MASGKAKYRGQGRDGLVKMDLTTGAGATGPELSVSEDVIKKDLGLSGTDKLFQTNEWKVAYDEKSKKINKLSKV